MILNALLGNYEIAQERLEPSELQRRHAFETLLLGLLGLYLLIDTLNGFFVKNLGLPNVLSAAYKQGFLLLLLVYAFQFEIRRFALCLLTLMAIFCWASLRFFLVDDVLFFYAFQEAVKVAYLFIMVFVISKFRLLTEKVLSWILTVAIAVLVLNVLMTFLGIGSSTYSDFGAKGFFYSGNAISGVIVICASYMLFKAYDKAIMLFLFITLSLTVLSLVIGTKSGFLGVALAAVMVMLIKVDARTLLIAMAIAIALTLFMYFFSDVITENPLYHRIVHFYKTGGLERVLFSGRDVKLATVWPVLSNGELLPFLFGANMNELLRVGVTRVEFDWIDMHINFGILLSLCVYLGYLILFFRMMLTPKTAITHSAIIAFVVLILISSIAGHVMYNGMVTPLWAVVIAAALNSNNVQNLDSYKVIPHEGDPTVSPT